MLTTMIALAALANTAADTSATADDTVVCLENTREETVVAFVAEKYRVGAKKVRQVVLESGKKSCMRYDTARNVTIKPYTLAEAERRVAEGDRIRPWRAESCERVGSGEAVFLRITGNDGEEGACQPDTDRSDADIRGLVAKATPLRP